MSCGDNTTEYCSRMKINGLKYIYKWGGISQIMFPFKRALQKDLHGVLPEILRIVC